MSFSDQVTVSRTVALDGYTCTETATATLADDLVLDDVTESLRRQMLAEALFQSLPSIQAQSLIAQPPCKPPTHSLN